MDDSLYLEELQEGMKDMCCLYCGELIPQPQDNESERFCSESCRDSYYEEFSRISRED